MALLPTSNAYGGVIARCFDMAPPQAIYHQELGATVTLVEAMAPRETFSAPMPYEDAYILIVRRKPATPFQLWIDGKYLASGALPEGSHSVLDQRSSPYCLRCGAFAHIQFQLPRPALNTLALEEGFGPVDAIDHRGGFADDDPALAEMAAVFEAIFRRSPNPGDGLMTSYLLVAVASRFVSNLATKLRAGHAIARPLLSRHQLQLVEDRIAADLPGEVSVFELAALCDLPVRTFCRAFKVTTGTTPSSWSNRHRIDRAVDLLRRTPSDLDRIANTCGLRDVDQMAEFFSRVLGHPPSAFAEPNAKAVYGRN